MSYIEYIMNLESFSELNATMCTKTRVFVSRFLGRSRDVFNGDVFYETGP